MGGEGVRKESERDRETGALAELRAIARTSEFNRPSALGIKDASKALACRSSRGWKGVCWETEREHFQRRRSGGCGDG
jgi:hypothetical protein